MCHMRYITPRHRNRFAALCVAVCMVTALSFVIASGTTARSAPSPARATTTATASSSHVTVTCGLWSAKLRIQCPDVYNPLQTFGYYVGHDEPGVWFYSHVPGSGNRAAWTVTMPKDPSPSLAGTKNYAFENHVAFWFGMPLCASQSFPEQTATCAPDSDSNIVDPRVSAAHAGSAYLELQFYPPGWAPFPSGVSCDATHWCAAMNVWSYYDDPVSGQTLNKACQAKVGGVELDNYAFVQLNGVPTGPPSPLDATSATFTPNSQTLLMGQGDRVGVKIFDGRDGLTVSLHDTTTHQTGTMVASAANGFAQLVYAPDPSTECTQTPYTFRPMYSTSTSQTRATWTAYPYAVAYADETGHFQFCGDVDTTTGDCAGTEGTDGAKADSDDYGCFAASQSTLDQVSGCVAANYGFDGTPYQNDWPNGSPRRGTPILFNSPLTGRGYNVNYSQAALAGPQPFIETGGGNQTSCDIFTGATGCTYLPVTDSGTPAAFYPYFYTTRVAGCSWGEGTDDRGLTVDDFGGETQYGAPNAGVYYSGTNGTPYEMATDFLHVFKSNPCPTAPGRA